MEMEKERPELVSFDKYERFLLFPFYRLLYALSTYFLAPFFGHSDIQKFVHKPQLFNVSNIFITIKLILLIRI